MVEFHVLMALVELQEVWWIDDQVHFWSRDQGPRFTLINLKIHKVSIIWKGWVDQRPRFIFGGWEVESHRRSRLVPFVWELEPINGHYLLELLHTHLGFIFPNGFSCLLVIISHYLVSYILGENILFQLALQFD